MVRPKKFLGQHFLRDKNIAAKIVDALQLKQQAVVLEIGPGTGVLTDLLNRRPEVDLYLSEIDRESVAYLKEHYLSLSDKIYEGDFIEMDLERLTTGKIHIIGNFPYNISSQIFFKILDYTHKVEQVVCMLQKEVADRLAEKEGTKTYGILSVLLQAYYTIEPLFKVPPGVFHPPPKVMSAVIRLARNNRVQLPCDEQLFRRVVKQSFQNRRKTLRNALKPLNLPHSVLINPLMDKRAEQLSVDDFILLTTEIEKKRGTDHQI
ncbi:MAG: 16S rRNA (adenine(1518)-N(6)/adenine(1519)-N(6))-dimethyltransferase RsmA [Bacteroidetes bacterium]|nr:16S rRNA (adenine(1518)-N(6)/adenine(1519)-N(6))-dimethyltransferase RsmA [Bacteroidota bacterium]MBS1539783.1 16S rRNA (adenine(1518)-N(6)/adenine(1519)-N(6))-dimethyltransferase RsmA [Bacteroidota bacterium]